MLIRVNKSLGSNCHPNPKIRVPTVMESHRKVMENGRNGN